MGKSRIEIQLQAYGSFQHAMRSMTPAQRLRYATPGTPEHEKFLENERIAAEIEAERQRQIKAFMADYPRFGSPAGLTDEQFAQMQAVKESWERRRTAFYADLDRRLPKPVTYWDGMGSHMSGKRGKSTGNRSEI